MAGIGDHRTRFPVLVTYRVPMGKQDYPTIGVRFMVAKDNNDLREDTPEAVGSHPHRCQHRRNERKPHGPNGGPRSHKFRHEIKHSALKPTERFRPLKVG